jgi:hypothetical protein
MKLNPSELKVKRWECGEKWFTHRNKSDDIKFTQPFIQKESRRVHSSDNSEVGTGFSLMCAKVPEKDQQDAHFS